MVRAAHALTLLLAITCFFCTLPHHVGAQETWAVNFVNYYHFNNASRSIPDIKFGFTPTDGSTNTFYFMNNFAPTVFWTTLPSSNLTNLQAQSIDFKNLTISDSESDTVLAAFVDTKENSVWIAGPDGFFKADLDTETVTTISEPRVNVVAGFADVDLREGYLIAEGKIYMADLDVFNYTRFKDNIINISMSPNERAVLYDKPTRTAWIGGANGLMRLDVTAKNVTYHTNVTLSAAVLVYDNARSRLYVCFNGDESTSSKVYSFDSVTMERIHEFDMGNGEIQLGDSCSGGEIDTQTGQLFMVITQGNTALVASWDLADNYKAMPVADSTQSPRTNNSYMMSSAMGTVKLPGARSFFILGDKQLVQLRYESNCPLDCSSHGTCNFGECQCVDDYVLPDCFYKACLNNCTAPDHGTCLAGACFCWDNYTNADCSERICDNACSGHGSCSNAPDYICTCTGGWSGKDCSTPPPPAPPPTCPEINDYTSCVGHDYCGWCGDIIKGRCMSGDIVGPVAGSCTDWNYDEPPEIGVIILAAIILAVVGFMFILDAISAIRLDLKRGRDLREEYDTGLQRKPNVTEAAALWWRDQRAAKAWTTLEHLQFLSVFANLALSYPTRYLYFSRFVYWTNLGLPLPFMRDMNIHEGRLTGYAKDVGIEAAKRELLGIEQYSNSLGVTPHDLYANNMFWFGIILGGVVVIYGLLSLIFYKKTHWRVVFTCRLVYMIFRVLSIAYLGLMMTCAYTLVHPEHDYRTLVPAIITLLVIGFGYPIGIYFILKGKNKQLFDNEFKFKFGCLYINYRPEHSLFSLRIIARKFLTGFLVGIMAVHLDNQPKYVAIIQAALLCVIQILYLVELARTHPYYDFYHEYLEYLLIVVNIGTIALSLVHYNSTNQPAYLITALIQVLALVACFGTYIISWMQMHPNFSFKKAFRSKKSEKPKPEGTEFSDLSGNNNNNNASSSSISVNE